MSFFEGIDSLKIEKERAMLRYLRLNKIGNVFRTLEFFFAALFLSWSICRSSPYLSAVFHLLAAFLRRLSALVVNHHFVFLVGNGIIAALFVKFGQFACDDQNSAAAADDYEIAEVVPPYDAVADPEAKQIIPAEKEIRVVEDIKASPEAKKCLRSRSEVFDREKTGQIKLRRSETEPRRNSASETAPIRRTFEEDNLSSEEFRQKVEAVIARHRRFLIEESFSIVST